MHFKQWEHFCLEYQFIFYPLNIISPGLLRKIYMDFQKACVSSWRIAPSQTLWSFRIRPAKVSEQCHLLGNIDVIFRHNIGRNNDIHNSSKHKIHTFMILCISAIIIIMLSCPPAVDGTTIHVQSAYLSQLRSQCFKQNEKQKTEQKEKQR